MIVPTIAIVLIAAIPFVDRGSRGMGVWWYSARGPRVAIFTTIYTLMVTAALIALDNYFPVKANFTTWLRTADNPQAAGNGGALAWLTDWFARTILGGDFSTAVGTQAAHGNATGTLVEALANWIVPIIFLTFFPTCWYFLLKAVFRGIDKTEIIIGLVYGLRRTLLGADIRGHSHAGPSQGLFPPWALPPDTAG